MVYRKCIKIATLADNKKMFNLQYVELYVSHASFKLVKTLDLNYFAKSSLFEADCFLYYTLLNCVNKIKFCI